MEKIRLSIFVCLLALATSVTAQINGSYRFPYSTPATSGVNVGVTTLDSIKNYVTTGLSDSLNLTSGKRKEIGYLYHTDFSNLTDFSNINAMIAYTPKFTISGGNGQTLGAYLQNNKITASNNYNMRCDFILNQIGTGIVIGKKSRNTTYDFSLYAMVKQTSSTLFHVELQMSDANGNVSARSVTADIAAVVGNAYRIEITGSLSTINVIFSNINPTKDYPYDVIEEKSIIYPINFLISPSLRPDICPNTNSGIIGTLGGSYTITNFSEYHYDELLPDVTFLGTSISTYNFFDGKTETHYIRKAFEETGSTFSVFSGGGDKISDMLLRINDVIRSKPKYCVIEGAANNVGGGSIRQPLGQIFDSLNANNIKFIFLSVSSNINIDTVAQNLCIEKKGIFKKVTGIDTYDGVHPNTVGNYNLAKFLRANCPQLFLKTGSVSETVVGNYIKNQTITQSDANFSISGIGKASRFESIQNDQNATEGLVLTNTAATGNYVKGISISQSGNIAYGITGWANAGVIEGSASGGLLLSAYNSKIKFQTGFRGYISDIENGNWTIGGEQSNHLSNAQLAIVKNNQQLDTETLLTYNTNALGQTLKTDIINNIMQARQRIDYDGNINSIARNTHQFWTGGDVGTGTQRLSILQNGNVGIGTTAPSAKLDVAGTLQATETGFFPSSSFGLSIGNGGVSANYIKANNNYFQLGNGQEYMTTNPYGYLGLGVNNASNRLHIVAAANPLRAEGLQTGSSTDQIVTVQPNGEFKQMTKGDVVNYSSYGAISTSTTLTAAAPRIIKTSGTVTFILPAASSYANKDFTFLKSDEGTILTIQANGTETINESNLFTIDGTGKWLRATLYSNGIEWFIIGQ